MFAAGTTADLVHRRFGTLEAPTIVVVGGLGVRRIGRGRLTLRSELFTFGRDTRRRRLALGTFAFGRRLARHSAA
jgi:hypothetical protein